METSDSITLWCPDCGAEYRPGFTQCSDCGVALIRRDPHAAPAEQFVGAPDDAEQDDAEQDDPERSDHEMLEYDLKEWTDEQRSALELLLGGAEIPFTWQERQLTVPHVHEAEVDELIDQVDIPVSTDDALAVPADIDESSGLEPL